MRITAKQARRNMRRKELRDARYKKRTLKRYISHVKREIKERSNLGNTKSQFGISGLTPEEVNKIIKIFEKRDFIVIQEGDYIIIKW